MQKKHKNPDENYIHIQGAKTHNLKNIDLKIPRDKLIVITGLSGSGKSSLAFDTLYAEGQRRYVASLSAYARQFLDQMEKPEVEHIEGLSPAISIEQKATSHNPRSTVGTITEIYDYLRLLFARVGEARCPEHNKPLKAQSVSQMLDNILALPEDLKLMLLAPIVQDRKGEYNKLLTNLYSQGFIRARIDGEVYSLDDPPELDLHKKHNIEIIIDRFKVKHDNKDLKQRLAESLETVLRLADGLVFVDIIDGAPLDKNLKFPILYSQKHACPVCQYSTEKLEPKHFSFNSPAGACSHCDGLGILQEFDTDLIIPDKTKSLKQNAIAIWKINNEYYFNILDSLAKFYKFSLDTPFKKLSKKIQNVILNGSGEQIIPLYIVSLFKDPKVEKKVFEGVIPSCERRFKKSQPKSILDEMNKFITSHKCPNCEGSRLNKQARSVFINNINIFKIINYPIDQAHKYFCNLKLDAQSQKIAAKILQEIAARLKFLNHVGLNYLSLARSADTLSGGESQRIRLASQIGSGLVGVMYILDEPSIGLHQRDNAKLLESLRHLQKLGNTVIVVEHDEEAIREADHIIDIGPKAGIHGGEIVAQGDFKEILKAKNSLTADYLSGKKAIITPKKSERIKPDFKNKKYIEIIGASGHNLKNIDVKIPLNIMTCITGVSGSGKSTLINQTLFPAAMQSCYKNTKHRPKAFKKINGLDNFDNIIDINQSPIGRTPRSNPATYTGIFSLIRELFAKTPEARSRGYLPGRFSFNVKGGRCESCQGDGVIKVEMHFLPDIYVNCDQCKSKRYNRETLEITYKNKNIHEILDMSIEEALIFFSAIPSINKKLSTLQDVGLSYIKLGQRATTLSGGEAQRIKLSKELSRRDTGNTLYILDEPTTGLHFHDINQLLKVILRLRDKGNTIIIIEHNLDVIKTCDWIIDLGPEGGNLGGEIICCGTPEDVAKCDRSATGGFIRTL